MTDANDGSEPAVALTGVRKAFGRNEVLRGVDLAVRPGESVAIIGGSGTGKSVALKCILGLLAPDSGSIRIHGEETTGIGQRSRTRILGRIGMLFQAAALFDSLTVWENVAFPLIEVGGMKRRAAREKAIQTLALVGLGADTADMMPASLSGGMQKRVGLARAIAPEPDILFFDEPTTGIDSIMGVVIDELIVRCVRELGAAALTITHDMASARRIADRAAMLYDGRIIWDGPVDVLDNSGDPYVDQFVHGRVEGPIRAIAAWNGGA